MRTLLERAKGSALDVTVCRDPPPGTITLLSPQFRQIRHLELSFTFWQDIVAYSEMSSGPLPLLSTLIVAPHGYHPPTGMTIPPPPFFGGAVNLKQFTFISVKLDLLNHFIFPNLTRFKLSALQAWSINVSDLLNFLKASPELRTVEITLDGSIAPESAPRETVTILPNVETLSLCVGNDLDVYEIATRISCPRANYTSLTHSSTDGNYTPDLEIFPTPASWSAISCQFSRSPVEEVTLEIKPDQYGSTISCSLTFQTSDTTTVRLCLRVDETGKDGVHVPFVEMDRELFSRACSAVQDHLSLSHIKRLHIKHRASYLYPDLIRMSDDVGRLFGFMGPLDELTIHGCDLRIFLGSFLDFMDLGDIPVLFPYIKKLTISHPSIEMSEEEYLGAIVDLAESQHEKGIPFERVTVRAEWLPTGMAERLREWVDAVEYYEEDCEETNLASSVLDVV